MMRSLARAAARSDADERSEKLQESLVRATPRGPAAWEAVKRPRPPRLPFVRVPVKAAEQGENEVEVDGAKLISQPDEVHAHLRQEDRPQPAREGGRRTHRTALITTPLLSNGGRLVDCRPYLHPPKSISRDHPPDHKK